MCVSITDRNSHSGKQDLKSHQPNFGPRFQVYDDKPLCFVQLQYSPASPQYHKGVLCLLNIRRSRKTLQVSEWMTLLHPWFYGIFFFSFKKSNCTWESSIPVAAVTHTPPTPLLLISWLWLLTILPTKFCAAIKIGRQGKKQKGVRFLHP